jgi:hypothetical protein
VCVRDGRFAEAWQRRTVLQVTGAMVWWDGQLVPHQAGAHKWVTEDLVLVERLLAAPGSGVRLASPSRVVAGEPGLADRLTAAHLSSVASWAPASTPLNAPTTSSRR